MTLAKRKSDSQPVCLDRLNTSAAMKLPICRAAFVGNCLANCIAMCEGIQDNGRVYRDSDQTLPRFVERTIDARRKIFRGGEKIDGVLIICRGWAATVFTLPNNSRQIVSLLLPGDLVSGALVFESKLDVSVEAITDVTYHIFDRSEFRTALFKNPGLFESILKIWTEQSLQIVDLAVSLGQCSAEERIARLVLNLMERLALRHMVENHTFHFPLRQWHIAEITGLTPVHVNRVINQLRRDGLIDMRNRSLTIRDPVALQRICNI